MMTYIKLTLSLYVLVIALWGCTDVDQQPFEEGSEATTKLTVNLPATKATADLPANESVVHRARVIVVASEGTTREGKVTGNTLFDNLSGLKLEALALSGISDIYVLANETPEQTEALNKIASLQQLKNALVRFHPLPVGTSAYDDLPMMALISNVTIDLDSKKNIFSTTLKRLWAKFNICFKAEGEYIDQVQLTSIELQSLPKYSYWLDGHAYPETNFTKGTKTDLNGEEGLLISATPTQSFVFYAPEYLVTDPDAHTRLIVRGYKKDNLSTLCVYRVALGHNPSPESEDESVDYNIHRNTRYNMTGVIKGYGGGDVDVEMTVNKWNDTVEMGEGTGNFLTLDKTEGADIVVGGGTSTFNILTSGAWTASIAKGSNAKLNKTSGTGNSSITITLPTNLYLTDYEVRVKVATAEGIRPHNEVVYTVKQKPSRFHLIAAGVPGSGSTYLSPTIPVYQEDFIYTVPTWGLWDAKVTNAPAGLIYLTHPWGDKQDTVVNFARTDYAQTATIVLTTRQGVVSPAQSATIQATRLGLLDGWPADQLTGYKLPDVEEIYNEQYNSGTNGASNTFYKGRDVRYAAARCFHLNRLRLGREPLSVSEMLWILPAVEQARAIVTDFVRMGRPLIRGPFSGWILDGAQIPGHFNLTSTAINHTLSYAMNPNIPSQPIHVIYSSEPYYMRCARPATVKEMEDAARGIYVP